MLARPPKLYSQDNQSQVYSESYRSKNSINKNKSKKKQSSLGGRRQHTLSNNSDHSNHSKSPKPQLQNNFDDIIKDNASVGSHASGKSKKSKKKQTSVKIDRNRNALNYKKQMQDSMKVLDYASGQYHDKPSQNYHEVQYSQVKGVNIESSEIKNIRDFDNKHQNQYKFVTQPQYNSNNIQKKPFSEIQIDQDDDLPVIQIKQVDKKVIKQKQTPKIAQKASTQKLGQMFQQNKKNMINQPSLSQQNKANINNNSEISDSFWHTSSIDNNSQMQSRKSRSKLGTLFKQKSKEKLNNQSSIRLEGSLEKSRDRSRSRGIFNNKNKSKNISNDSEASTFKNYPANQFNVQEQRKDYDKKHSNKLVSNVRTNYMEPKKVDSSQDQFDGGQLNRSQLDLSQSHHAAYSKTTNHNKDESKIQNSIHQKDSLCFNIEPDKSRRKGLGLVSKKGYHQQKNMIKIDGQLNSVALGNAHNSSKDMIKLPQVLQSKSIETTSARNKVQAHLMQNQRYLAESGFTQNMENKRQEESRRKIEEEKQKIKRQQKQREIILKQKQEFIRKRQQQLKREQLERDRKMREQKQRIARQQMQIERRKLEKQQQKVRKQQQQQRMRKQQQRIKYKKAQEERIKNQIQKQRQKQRQQYLKKQKQLEERQKKLRQLESQFVSNQSKQKQSYSQIKSNNKVAPDVSPLEHLPSTYSREQSQNGSSRSASVKKAHKKKQSSINLNKKPQRKYFGDISPRGQDSFYQDDPQQSNKDSQQNLTKNNNPAPKQNKLISFSDDDDSVAHKHQPSSASNKFNTDINFYENSVKVPSSKPPLSRKSVSSKGKSKPKQSSIAKKKNDHKKVSKIGPNNSSSPSNQAPRKLTLVELAMQKDYEPRSDSQYSNDGSQYSFASKQQSNIGKYSKKSCASRNSSRSLKKQSVIKSKQSSLQHRPPPYKRKMSHQQQLQQIQQQRQQQRQLIRQQEQQYMKPIVTKDCFYIDERGRLVKKDLIIKGNKVGSNWKEQFDPKQVYNRLQKSRQKRRSRSRERSRQRSLGSSQTSFNKTTGSFQNIPSTISHDPKFIQSEAYVQSAGESAEHFYSQTQPRNRMQFSKNNQRNGKVQGRGKKLQNYDYSSSQLPYQSSYSNFKQNNATLNEFLKPVQTSYTGNQQNYYHEVSRQSEVPNKIIRKRGLKRTEKSASKKLK